MLALMLMVAACGRKGPLDLPEGRTEISPPPSSQQVPAEGERPSDPFILDALL